MINHCRTDYDEREQYLTCVHCGHVLLDNQMVKDAYQMNTQVGWARQNLKILADMASGRGMDWFVKEVNRILEGMDAKLKH